MAEGIAAGPGAADEFADPSLAAETVQAALVVAGQTLVIPADGTADLIAGPVDPAGGVVRGRDSPCHPMIQPAQVAKMADDGPHAGTRLPLQLHQVQLGYTPTRPQVGGQPDLRQRSAVEIERQTLDP